jgi:hypothetical protein
MKSSVNISSYFVIREYILGFNDGACNIPFYFSEYKNKIQNYQTKRGKRNINLSKI